MSKIPVYLIDADLLDGGTNHPNLALMKLSAYYKETECAEVMLLEDYSDLPQIWEANPSELVYISKVFTKTNIPDWVYARWDIRWGGTGYIGDKDYEEHAYECLPEEVEHLMPDYDLYAKYIEKKVQQGDKLSKYNNYLDQSIGFLTRGCFRKCDFCVNKKYDEVKKHSELREFYDSNKRIITLWDDNFLAYSNWKEELLLLQDTNKHFRFKQGLDVRLINDEKAELLSKSKYYKDFIFAFDHVKDLELIDSKLKLWRSYCDKSTKLYLLVAYESQCEKDILNLFIRLEVLFKHKCLPYVMRYEEYENSSLKDMYINLTRWCNQPSLVRKISFREFCMKDQERLKDQSKKCSSLRALDRFEKDYPNLCTSYFDMKYSDY